MRGRGHCAFGPGPVDNRVQRRVTLGYPRERDGAPTLSLAQARAAAREVRVAAAEGRSLVPGDGIRGAQTFAQLANEYIAWVECQRRPVTVAEIGRVLRHRDLAEWRDRPAVRITTDDVSSPRCDPRARAGHGDARPADHQWIGHVGGE